MLGAAVKKLKTEIEALQGFQYDDDVFLTWLRLAEAKISQSLRSEYQVTIAVGKLTEGRVSLPSGWQEIEFVRIKGGESLRLATRDQLINKTVQNGYAVVGNYIIVGPPIDAATGLDIELTFFSSVPTLDVDDNWMSTAYRWLLTAAVGGYAALHVVEDARAAALSASMVEGIAGINSAYQAKRFSGSVVVARPNRVSF